MSFTPIGAVSHGILERIASKRAKAKPRTPNGTAIDYLRLHAITGDAKQLHLFEIAAEKEQISK